MGGVGMRRAIAWTPEGSEDEIETEVDFDYVMHKGYGARLYTAMAGPGEPPWAELIEVSRVDGSPMEPALLAAAERVWEGLAEQIANDEGESDDW
jgi:hypothetical protein